MANSRLELQQIKTSLIKINTHFSAKNPTSFLPGETEDLSTIPALLNLVEIELTAALPNGATDQFKASLKEIFISRWQRIANAELCYTQFALHPLNQVFIRLAAYIEPQKINSLLMPLVAQSDIFGYELNQLELNEFIITDNRRQFITLEGLVNSACERMLEGNQYLFVTVNEAGQIRPLSASELQRCGKLISTINSIAQWFSNHQGNCLALLTTLRDSLLRGDVEHGGEEMNAGSAANVGLAHFAEYYHALPNDTRLTLRNLRDGSYTFGMILDRLLRPSDVNYREARYCIQSLGRILEGIINVNANMLSGLAVDQTQNLRSLINLVKMKLSGYDLSAPTVERDRQPEQRERSRLNPDLTFNENEFVVSLIATKRSYFVPTTAKIIVEGVKNGRVFVGSYYVTAQSGTGWPLLSDQLQNTPGVISKVKTFESYGYAQIPEANAEGRLGITDNGAVSFKFDQLEELRKSMSRSHQVPADNVKDMIQAIKQDATTTEFAYWIYGQASLTPVRVSEVLRNNRVNSLFIPYEPFGKYSLFGHGKNNCVTWCEDKLAIAGCGQHSVADKVKAKPLLHVKWN